MAGVCSSVRSTLTATVCLFAAGLSPLAAIGAEPQKVMVFDFSFDNTSMEPTTPAESARIKAISGELRDLLQKSGRYEVSAGDSTSFTSVQDIGKCTDGERSLARKGGASLVACGWVQKVSNLILNLNLVIEDAASGSVVQGGSVDIRGNTDESWDHGLHYLLQEHVFRED